MADGYGVCPHCLWNGKLRRDGTVRRHRDQRRAADGSQRCTGEGERPLVFRGRAGRSLTTY